jgi:hypothetical protein
MTAGKKRATMKTAAGYADAWIGFSPSGAHWLTYADGKLLSESGIVQAHAPYPMGAVVFDGENEYHYMGEDGLEVQLVCGALGGSAHGTRCAKKARARGLHSSDD